MVEDIFNLLWFNFWLVLITSLTVLIALSSSPVQAQTLDLQLLSEPKISKQPGHNRQEEAEGRMLAGRNGLGSELKLLYSTLFPRQ